MTKLFGREYSKEEFLSYVGDFSQVAGVQFIEISDGPGRGNRVAEVNSGNGLQFSILLDRGMDIGKANYKGIPLSWLSPGGFVRPTSFEPEGLGWLYGFGGGLMTGCGLTYLGAPNVDEGEALGLHGRLSFIPGQNINSGETWKGNECRIWVEGQVRQTRVHGEYLSLKRRISTVLGESSLRIEDTVENLASKPSPLMILYHINLGYPMVDENSYLVAQPHSVKSRDSEAEKGISNWDHFQKPTPGYDEQVFYHDILADKTGWSKIELINPKLNIKLGVHYKKEGLHNLVQWKMMGKGTYVLGLEPGNCNVAGRNQERLNGTLQYIQPGESRDFEVEISVQDL